MRPAIAGLKGAGTIELGLLMRGGPDALRTPP